MSGPSQTSMFSSEEHPASPSRSRDLDEDLLTRAGTWPSPSLRLLNAIAPVTWYGKTSPACCQRTKDGLLEPSSEGWQSSGMGGPTESWTLSILDSPNDASVCSLSAILETGDVPQRFFLSPKAC